MISVQCAPFCQHRKQTKRANKDILLGKIVWGPVGIPWLLSFTSSACEMGKNICSLHHPVGIWDTAHPWRVTDGVLLVKAVPMYISVSRCAISLAFRSALTRTLCQTIRHNDHQQCLAFGALGFISKPYCEAINHHELRTLLSPKKKVHKIKKHIYIYNYIYNMIGFVWKWSNIEPNGLSECSENQCILVASMDVYGSMGSFKKAL